MAEQPPSFQFQDLPLDEARRMGRGPRIDPELYRALQQKLPSLDNTAARMTIPEGTSPTTMKHRILRVAAALDMPLTIRKVPGGLLFWRATDEDRTQANEIAQRLQTARKPRQTTRQNRTDRPRGRRRA
jgi:hypothetical protein